MARYFKRTEKMMTLAQHHFFYTWSLGFILLLGSNHPLQANGPSRPQSPSWQDHIESLQAIEPNLQRQDKKLYDAIHPLLNANPQAAIAELEQSTSATTSPIFDFYLGNLYLSQEQTQKAEQALLKSLEKFPRFEKAHRSLASLYARLDQWDLAQQHASKVIELGGTDAFTTGLLAYTHFQNGHHQSALSAYRLASMLDPQQRSHRLGELYCLVHLKKNGEVLSLSQELLEREPQRKQLWLFQVNALLTMNRQREAISRLEIMRHQGMVEHQELTLLGNLYFNEEIYDPAVEIFLEAMKRGAPQKVLMQPLLALLNQGESELAQRIIETAKKIYPNQQLETPERWALAEAQLHIQLKQDDRAEAALRQLLQRWPMNEGALMSLAQHLISKHEIDEAIFFLERAALLENVQVQAWQELGRLSWEDGQTKVAIKWLSRVLEVQPTEQLRETLERMRERL
jgi:tetratricopeptide (TPR) repeat protein